MFRDSHVVKNELFLNPSTSLLELSCVIFHLKAFPKECCYCGAYQWSKFSPILSVKEVFISSLISSKQLFPSVAGCHLIMLRCFHKPTTNLFFSLLVFQQLYSNLRARMPSKFNCGRSWHFLLHSFIPMVYLIFVLPEALWCSALHKSPRFVRIMFFSCLSI